MTEKIYKELKATDIQIPPNILEKWQNIVNILAETNSVPVALIMKMESPNIAVFRSSNTEGNPYKVGDKEHLDGSGLYCETVINNREMLLVPNALKDVNWHQNPDIELGMISYLGFPLIYPDGTPFGTICILDSKENEYNNTLKNLLEQFKEVIESHLQLLYLNEILSKSEEKYKQLVTLANTIIIHMDKYANIEYINQYGEKIFEFEKGELLGKSVIGTIVPKTEISGRDLELMVKEVFQSPNKFKLNENENITKNGKRLWISWANQAIVNQEGKLIGLLCIGTDITEKKHTEQKLKESEARYRKAYEEANFYKDLFSHDISNSIQAISSNLEIYQMKKDLHGSTIDIEDIFKKIKKSSDQAINIIQKVRKLSEIEESDIFIKKIEILGILRKNVNDLEKIYSQKHLDININPYNEHVYINANELIENVFQNILVNAINYNEKLKVEINVKISVSDDLVKIEFMDNGIGISDEEKLTIFKKGAKKGSKGMGLGLSLVKKLIDKYNGRIWVEDRIEGSPSSGSNFSILIPKA